MKRSGEALDAARRASARSASLVHDEMKRGLSSLAFIKSTALWVGVFGALLCVYDSFGGMRSENTTLITVVFEGLSQALVLFAFGLIVSLTAMWCRKYLLTKVEAFDSDMENASLQL